MRRAAPWLAALALGAAAACGIKAPPRPPLPRSPAAGASEAPPAASCADCADRGGAERAPEGGR